MPLIVEFTPGGLVRELPGNQTCIYIGPSLRPPPAPTTPPWAIFPDPMDASQGLDAALAELIAIGLTAGVTRNTIIKSLVQAARAIEKGAYDEGLLRPDADVAP